MDFIASARGHAGWFTGILSPKVYETCQVVTSPLGGQRGHQIPRSSVQVVVSSLVGAAPGQGRDWS